VPAFIVFSKPRCGHTNLLAPPSVFHGADEASVATAFSASNGVTHSLVGVISKATLAHCLALLEQEHATHKVCAQED
jgi:hypothetical protein